MEKAEQPKMVIPYFEYLRLVSWMLAAEPRRLLVMGSLSVRDSTLSVDRFNLPKQMQVNGLKDQLESASWDLATTPAGDMPLLVISDCLLLLPHELSQTMVTVLQFLNVGVTNQMAFLVIGGQHQAHAYYILLKPFLMNRKLEVYLSMPRADDSARDHWMREYTESINPGQATKIPDTPWPPEHSYSFHYLPSTLFFDEPGLDISRITKVLTKET